jgi:hypothetical protein
MTYTPTKTVPKIFVSLPFRVILRTLVRRISFFDFFDLKKQEILRFAQNDSVDF